jgi:hypothetical protein
MGGARADEHGTRDGWCGQAVKHGMRPVDDHEEQGDIVLDHTGWGN